MINMKLSTNTQQGRKYLGGAIDSSAAGILQQTQVTSNFVFDEVSKIENINEVTDYRCLYVKNDYEAKTVYNVKLRILTVPSVSDFWIALVPKGDTAESIVNENTEPTGLTFYNKTDLDTTVETSEISNGYLKGPSELVSGEYFAIWFKRKAKNVGGSGTTVAEFSFDVTYDS